tara:strand:+ start:521 stop:778 length:258 start_codon:yes stop_codon:yes gene_type:complete
MIDQSANIQILLAMRWFIIKPTTPSRASGTVTSDTKEIIRIFTMGANQDILPIKINNGKDINPRSANCTVSVRFTLKFLSLEAQG